MEFTFLENEILKWIANHTDEPSLKSQIFTATLVDRDYTGHGFYVHLAMPVDAPKVLPEKSPIQGPHIESPQLEHGGDSLLFLKHGIVDWLEIYAYGDLFPELLSAFVLSEWEGFQG